MNALQELRDQVAAVARVMRTKTREEWTLLLDEHGIPCSPVHTLGELALHPQTQASDMVLHYRNDQGRELKTVASPLRANGVRPALRTRPPRLGQDTEEILSELGYNEPQIQALLADKVVAAPAR